MTVREPPGVPLRLDTVDPDTTWVVLERVEGLDAYELVGFVSIPPEDAPFDFFADKPEYLWTSRDIEPED